MRSFLTLTLTLTRTVNQPQGLVLIQALLPENNSGTKCCVSWCSVTGTESVRGSVLPREFGASGIVRKTVGVKVWQKHHWTSGYQEIIADNFNCLQLKSEWLSGGAGRVRPALCRSLRPPSQLHFAHNGFSSDLACQISCVLLSLVASRLECCWQPNLGNVASKLSACAVPGPAERVRDQDTRSDTHF